MSWWRERPEILRDAVGAVPLALLVAVNQRTPDESSDNLRLIIYLLIAGTGLLFAVLVVAIVFLMMQ